MEQRNYIIEAYAMPIQQLKSILTNGKSLIYDIRSTDEYQKDHLEGAFSLALPSMLFRRLLRDQVADRDLKKVAVSGDFKLALSQLESLESSDLLIVYDEKTSHVEDSHPDFPLRVFIEIFVNMGFNVTYIDGGINVVRGSLPELVTSASGGHVFSGKPVSVDAIMHAREQQERNFRMAQMTSEESAGLARLEDLNFMHGFLAVGTEAHGQDFNYLVSKGITHVVNVTATPFDERVSRHFQTLQISINDSVSENLLNHLFGALCFIDSARQNGGKVLVHCFAGISRSVSVCVAYIMWAHGMSVGNAIDFVKSHRSCASPNLGFIGQLIIFERTLRELSDIGMPRDKLLNVCNLASSKCV